MQDRPTYHELLEAVQHFIETDVVPSLNGPKKFHARVAANVLSIVRRELVQEDEDAQLQAEWSGLDKLLGPQPRPSDRREARKHLRARIEELNQRIRHGDADDGNWREQVIAHVRQTVIDKLAVANPKYLGAEIESASKR